MSGSVSRNTLLTGGLLAAFGIVASLIVASVFVASKDKIAQAEREKLLDALNVIFPAQRYDNDLVNDRIVIDSGGRNKKDELLTVYRARKNKNAVGAIFQVIAPDGYSGSIKLLVGVTVNGDVAGVRVMSHKETPGLGDYIEETKSNWILGFDGRSLGNPSSVRWRVKKDGGDFDQVTGATITPRAIVKAVKRTLEYFADHKQEIFSMSSVNSSKGRG